MLIYMYIYIHICIFIHTRNVYAIFKLGFVTIAMPKLDVPVSSRLC